ncbi:uncharacterized protein LOC134532522 [Bacillus rossius redtenbacheri]|uniref:uncharacterized protein LOC134532522 n=1 Tax=Bacillus rossius redtenbacheri TaxID=93214 RepID=UPI002FDEB2FE
MKSAHCSNDSSKSAARCSGTGSLASQIQGLLSECCGQQNQNQQPSAAAPAAPPCQSAQSAPPAATSLHFRIDPCQLLAQCLAAQNNGNGGACPPPQAQQQGACAQTQAESPPQAVRVCSQVQMCIQMPAAPPPAQAPAPVSAPKSGGGQGNVLEDLRKNILALKEQVSKVLESLTASHRHYCEEVEVEKQRRDSVLGRVCSLNRTLQSLQEARMRGPVREEVVCVRGDPRAEAAAAVAAAEGQAAGVVQWQLGAEQRPDPCGPPDSDDEGPGAGPVTSPQELCRRLAEWQKQLSEQMGGGAGAPAAAAPPQQQQFRSCSSMRVESCGQR